MAEQRARENGWTRVRLNATGRQNLYRHRGTTFSGRPREVEHFVQDAEARTVLGRWAPCPNVNVARRIMGLGAKP